MSSYCSSTSRFETDRRLDGRCSTKAGCPLDWPSQGTCRLGPCAIPANRASLPTGERRGGGGESVARDRLNGWSKAIVSLQEGHMHRVDSRTYVGQPDEVVTLTTQVDGGGQVTVVVNGQDIGGARQFPLPSNAGQRLKFQVSLMGPLGASCVVGIFPVDGSSDGDFLMCQAHNPAPVNFYTCSVAAAPTMNALAEVTLPQPGRAAPTRKKSSNRNRKKTSNRKKSSNKSRKRTRKASASKKKGGRK